MKEPKKTMKKPEIEFVRYDSVDVIITSDGPQKSPMKVSKNESTGYNGIHKSNDFESFD